MFNSHRKADLLENKRLSCSLDEMKAKLIAINRTMAIIEFTPDGIIVEANDNFCRTMGYAIEEIRGKHHRIFANRLISVALSTLNSGKAWPRVCL